jgi:AmmeMemoRadiSam system protein A
MSELAAYARKVIEDWVLHRSRATQPASTGRAAGCFVSLHDGNGQLRGCIGTIEPRFEELILEVQENAIAAASRDPRFPPLSPTELADLRVSVSELAPAEPIAGLEQLDPKIFGVIVEARGRRGVLLPDLPGIDEAAQQVANARSKAGLSAQEPVRLFRFQAVHHE